MKNVATLILNRNLPEPTDALVEHLKRYDGDVTDVFVIESGSDPTNLSRNVTWYADWPEALEQGLRYSRGMNYGLSQLWKQGYFQNYDAFFLLTNDTEFSRQPTIPQLLEVFNSHQRVGILSPCSKLWGEKTLLQEEHTKYFWFIHNTAYFLRRKFIESICNYSETSHVNFLFDGENFRGYGNESELIAKAYANDWAAAITSKVWAEENESYLLTKSDIIKTEAYKENIRLYIAEGRAWMKKKYGFNSRWTMQQYVKSMYDNFFEFYPEYNNFKI